MGQVVERKDHAVLTGALGYRGLLKCMLRQRILLVLIVLCTVVSMLIPSFLTLNNLMNVARQISINGIVAVGMTFVILTGGIDISVGSIVALGGVIAGMSIRSGLGLGLSVLLSLMSGALVGLFNGAFITYGKVLPFIATLGSMHLVRGLVMVISNGQAIWGLPRWFSYFGIGYVGPIPIPVIIYLTVFAIGHVVLKHFDIGRYAVAVGSNEEAARLCGVPVNRVKITTYTLCGVLSALAGVVLSCRLATSQPIAGSGYELVAIASVVIGGTSLLGGKGSMVGTLFGTLVLGVVSNALNLLNVSSFYQSIITGAIVLVAVLFDMMRK